MLIPALDELDLKIVHALQLEPRASWESLGAVLGAAPATLSRRWTLLTESGQAWQTALRGRVDPVALVEITCTPGAALDVGAAAARDPRIISIDLTSGRRDLLLTVAATDLNDLAEYIIHRIGAIPGVVTAQTYVGSESFRLGSSWTVRALTRVEADQIPSMRPPRLGAAKSVPAEYSLALRAVLAEDPRMPFGEVASRVGISAQRVSDYLALLRKNGSLLLRTDIAAEHSSWPIVCWYFIQLPAASFEAARAFFARSSEVQFAAATTGGANLLVAISARTTADLLPREAELEAALPGARVVDRSLVLRMFKHLGRIMTPDGRATQERVPIP